MKIVIKYLLITFLGIFIINGCKKDESEKQTSQTETKILVNTYVSGLGKTAGVQVSLHLNTGPAIEQVSGTDGKAVFEDVQSGYYHGSATYDDGNGQEYMIGIPTFRVDEGETVEKDIELQ